ncbi:MAG: FG-GAP repeat domain-containing protein, partial [Gammaproteobacteria bacterium]
MTRTIGSLALLGVILAGVLLALPQKKHAFNAIAAEALELEHIVVDKAGPNEPWGKGAGDINEDGLPDLVVGGNSSQDLFWYENPSWQKRLVAKGLPFSTDHEVADVDLDGKNDIISITDGQLVWFKNPTWKPYVIATEELHDVQVADFDRDGHIDLVARNQGAFGGTGARLFFYRQESPANWSAFTVDIPEGEGLATADVDGDGNTDAIVNGVWLENGGEMKGSAWTLHTYTRKWDWENAFVATGDINGDGRLDIVLTPSELAGEWYRIAWFQAPKNPRRVWDEHVVEENVEAVHHFVGTADMDNDGHVDIVTAEMHQGEDPDEVKVYLNRKNGAEWQKMVLATTGSHGMRLVDIDKDGDMDLFGANWSGEHQAVELWRNRSCQGGKWRRHVIDEDKPWRSVFIQTADLDGDGLLD